MCVRRGVGAMEIVAMDMKVSGMYIARQLSFSGVTFRIEEIPLAPAFERVYNRAALLVSWVAGGLWQHGPTCALPCGIMLPSPSASVLKGATGICRLTERRKQLARPPGLCLEISVATVWGAPLWRGYCGHGSGPPVSLPTMLGACSQGSGPVSASTSLCLWPGLLFVAIPACGEAPLLSLSVLLRGTSPERQP